MDITINILQIIGGASIVCKVLEIITKLTPTQKDDNAVKKAIIILEKVKKIIDYPALNNSVK